MLDSITPVILTFNEEENVARTLSRLSWARRVVVLDSGSTDATPAIVRAFKNADLIVRKFDTHASQWTYAVRKTGIDTPWVLRLDADYLVTDELIDSMSSLTGEEDVDGYLLNFAYAVHGHRLKSSLYPSNVVLFRRDRETIVQDGHTERWRFKGKIARLNGSIVHDDRKSVEDWARSQIRYMRSEVSLLRAAKGLKSTLRRCPPLYPLIVFVYTLVVKRALFSGRAGIMYALQRLVAECILSLMYLDEQLRISSGDPPVPSLEDRDVDHPGSGVRGSTTTSASKS